MRSTRKRLAALSATTAVVLSPLAFAAPPAFADTRGAAQIRVVSPTTGTAEKWVADAYEGTDTGDYVDPNQSFELAGGAPLGQGAHFFTMGAFSVQVELHRTTALDGAQIADLSRLDYSTWAKANGGRAGTAEGAKQPGYLRLSISSDGKGAKDTTLNFEPASNGTVKQGEWQDWSTVGGTWRIVEGPGETLDGPTTLAAYAIRHPAATIATDTKGGGVSLVAGMSGANQTYAKLGFDRVAAEVRDQVYLWDFETGASTPGATTASTVDSLTGAWNTSAWDYSANGGAGASTPVRTSLVLGTKVKAPAGKGSAQLEIGDNADATQFLRSTVLDGKSVDDLRTLQYSTFAEKLEGGGATPQQPPYLRLSIASTGMGAKDTTLNFEPANNSVQAAVANGVWQRWDAIKGTFRVVEGPGEAADSHITLAAYMARHPNATFVANKKDFGGEGALSFVIGTSGDNQRNARFNVDKVTVGTSALINGAPRVAVTEYDLEPTFTAPTANSVKRTGSGPVTLTGTGAAAEDLEIRVFENNNWDTVAGTTAVRNNGTWSFTLPQVSTQTQVRAWVKGTYGTADVSSATATVSVATSVALTVRTSGGYTYGLVKLNPAVGGTRIVWQQYVNKRWVRLSENITTKSGAAALRWNTAKGKTYTLRAVAASTKANPGGISSAKSIRSS